MATVPGWQLWCERSSHRRGDIVPIARHFLVEFGEKHGKSVAGFSPETEAFLKDYEWKGNIRELRNLTERGVLIGTGPDLTLADLGLNRINNNAAAPQQLNTDSGMPVLHDEGIDLNALEEHNIKEAFRKAGGNETKAAQLLQMSYYAFRYRRKKIKDRTPQMY